MYCLVSNQCEVIFNYVIKKWHLWWEIKLDFWTFSASDLRIPDKQMFWVWPCWISWTQNICWDVFLKMTRFDVNPTIDKFIQTRWIRVGYIYYNQNLMSNYHFLILTGLLGRVWHHWLFRVSELLRPIPVQYCKVKYGTRLNFVYFRYWISCLLYKLNYCCKNKLWTLLPCSAITFLWW